MDMHATVYFSSTLVTLLPQLPNNLNVSQWVKGACIRGISCSQTKYTCTCDYIHECELQLDSIANSDWIHNSAHTPKIFSWRLNANILYIAVIVLIIIHVHSA